MDCETWQEAIGAVIDGEDPGVDPALIDAHLASCSDCAAFREFGHALRRAALAPAASMPDLAPQVVKAQKVADGARTWNIPRGVLGICAIEVIVFSVVDLVASGSSHDSRHLGSFSLAYGVLLLVVFARPARARAMLPVALMLGLALAITAAIDMATGRVPLVNEALHIPELISVAMVWILAAPTRMRPHDGRRISMGSELRSVDRLKDTA